MIKQYGLIKKITFIVMLAVLSALVVLAFV